MNIFTKKDMPKFVFSFLTAIYCFGFSFSAMAQGNLMLSPKRVVFEGSKKSEEITLANIGKDTAKYNISFVQIKMKEDGSFETIKSPEPGQLFADSNIRIFPRVVVLAPNESQTVKLQVIKKNQMRDGEYRSHLYFRSLSNDKPLDENEIENKNGVSIKLIPIYGISIPIIIRVGQLAAQVSITDETFKMVNDTTPVVNFTFNRTGNVSVYGDVTVNYVSAKGKGTNVGRTNGLAIYTPTAKRTHRMVLNNIRGVNYRSGKLKVSFFEQTGKNKKIAEADIPLN